MRTKRRFNAFSRDQGMTLIEVVVIVGVLAILTGWVRPMAKRIVHNKKLEDIKSDLNILAQALEQYWLDNHTNALSDVVYGFFPTSISASGFYGVYYPADPDIYTDKFAYTENDASTLWRSYQYGVSGTPKVAYIYSIGPDGLDDQLVGGDDIIMLVSSERIGRAITRKKLRDIGRAAVDYIVGNKLVSSSDAWTLTESATLCSTNFGMDTWYDKDGWGNQWQLCTTRFRIYSMGPDGVDDTGDTTNALTDDDIGW